MNVTFSFTSTRRFLAFVLLLIALFQPTRSLAQVARLYTSQHGLKTNNCNSVDIDSRGLVWVSGANTLGIFDGWRFYYFPIETKEGRQLFQNSYRVQEAADNHYWICTSHGLYLLDARTNQFNRFYLTEQEDSIYGYAVNAIIDYPKPNHKLVTTDGFNSYVVNTATMKVDTTLSRKVNRQTLDGFVNRPLIDKHAHLWATTNNNPLICIDLKKFERRQLQYSPAAAALVAGCTVTSLLETKNGLLIGTNHGLLSYDEQENLVKVSDIPAEGMNVRTLIRTHDQRILIGTDGRGIWEYLKEGNAHILRPLYSQVAQSDLSYGKVMAMKEDNKGNVIAAFLQKGLVVIPPQNDCFHYHPISPLANGQNSTSVTSMAIDEHQNYWVATDGCGVFTTNGMKLATARPVNEGLSSLLVQDVKVDKHGTVWAACYGGGVQYLKNGRWTDEGLSSLGRQELAMTMHYDAARDRLLVGTNGSGIFQIDAANHTVEKVELPFHYNQWVSSVLRDRRGTFWIATSMGLFHYNQKTQKQGEIMLNGERICNAPAIHEDGNLILIATNKGLLIYDVKSEQQTLIAKAEGLSCNDIRAITTTTHHIWLATRTNIASVDKQNHEVRNFSSFSGYEIGEFHRNSALKPGMGYILFGGDNGIICFTPKLISNRPTEIKHVYFTNFSTPLHTEELDANIFYASKVCLNYDNSSFTIDFSSAELGDPERIHYDYILEGHEKQWHMNTPTPSANYSSLPPGNYTLRVRAYPEDDPAACTENALSIHVGSPWYATIWAYLVYAAFALAIAYTLYQQIKARKQQRDLLRKSAESARMKEAKLHLFTSITHELRSPLTMIESPLKQLMEEDTNPNHQSLYAVMRRNCDRLLGIVKQITDIRKIDSGQLELKLEECDYVAYSNRVFEQFEGVASVKSIRFEVTHKEETLPMMLDVTHFEKIITNLLSNAFKFTPEGGRVAVTSGVAGNEVELTFYNSGSHFNDEDLAHLWERFYQGSAGTDATGSGIGLNLVYELVKMHHGTIKVKNLDDDENTQGVEFTLHFPYFNAPSPATESSSKATLLLVDDDAELVRYMSSQLEKDYNIITAFSGESGWKQVLSQRPSAVVTDYRMPNGNGMELCQRIKSNPDTDNIPVILLTGEGDETLQLHSLNVQVDHYLEKPVNIVMLRSALQQVLRVRENLRNKARRAEVVDEMPKPVMENADDKLFSRVNDIIKKHLDDSEFSVQQLSEEVGISRVHLNRKMKERYGISPNIFIKSFRLKQAAYLLANNRVNISEVAYKVGFSSHSYFTTSFHEYFGMSPKEFVTFYSAEENAEALQKLLE